MRIPRRIALVGAALLAIIVLPAAITFYTDWLWFAETGYQQVFVGTLKAQSQLGAAAMGLAFVVLFANVLHRAAHARAARLGARHTRRADLHLAGSPPRAAGRDGDRGVVCAPVRLCLRRASGRPGCCSGTRSRSARAIRSSATTSASTSSASDSSSCCAASCWRWSLVSALAAGAIYALAGVLDWSRGARIGRPARRHLAALAACAVPRAGVRRVSRRPRAADPARPASSTASRTSTRPSGFRRCAR